MELIAYEMIRKKRLDEKEKEILDKQERDEENRKSFARLKTRIGHG